MSRRSLMIGFPHGESQKSEFVKSKEMFIADLATKQAAGVIDSLPIQGIGAGAMNLDRARNAIVTAFLDTDREWLLQIDTDMEFEPRDVWALLGSAHVKKRPVMGALCFRLEGMNPDIGPVIMPTMYRFLPNGEHRPVMVFSGIEKVDVTGGAFLLAHRSVYEKIGSDWFSHHPEQTVVSEDWAFCLRLRDHGIPLHVDTRVCAGHWKPVRMDTVMYRNMLARMNELDGGEWQRKVTKGA